MSSFPAQRGRRARAEPGLYDPTHEHDGCGVAAVARLDGVPIHDVVERALRALNDLEHRGAAGADPGTGDGAGILLGLPHEFLAARASEFGVDEVPPADRVAVAMCFFSADEPRIEEIAAAIERTVDQHGCAALGWRDVPTDSEHAGETSRSVAPIVRQLLIGAGAAIADGDAFELRLFLIRRLIEREVGPELHFASFSSRTIVFKGMLTAPQLAGYFPDLRQPEMRSAIAVVHSRFSTNTFPSWELAHPHRFSAHNGEINTLLGNLAWMRAREGALRSAELGDDLERCLPLMEDGISDSAAFDRALELLLISGRSLTHALMMLIPMAHERNDELPEELHDFYRYHASLIEPWDGPAAIVASDGRQLAATLDRNGLRPGRWLVTDDGWVVLGSEAGVLPFDPKRIVKKGRLRPGHMFIVDVATGRVSDELEAELEVARQAPYGAWHAEHSLTLDDLPALPAPPPTEPLRARQLAFGYSQEDLRVLIGPTANDGAEPVGSMGNDAALAALSERQPTLFSYFKQRYAQVTNPPIDSVREQIVMSLEVRVGDSLNLLEETPEHANKLVLEHPVLRSDDLERIARSTHPAIRARTIDATWPLDEGPEGLATGLRRICEQADEALADGATVLILSDRAVSAERVPVPSLLALGTVHHHLVRAGIRLDASIIVDSGEPREVHHLACLIGFGASAVSPYLMLESVEDLSGRAELDSLISDDEARERIVAAMRKGLLKVISKIGIATISSYCGAQVFEAVGLDKDLVMRHFTGTPSAVGGIGLDVLAAEACERHARAYPERHGRILPEHVEDSQLPAAHANLLPQGGIYAWRRDGERHAWDPPTIAALQQSVRSNGAGAESYAEFAKRVNEENGALGMLRGLLRLGDVERRAAIAEVEPASEIVKRFVTGGMSLGALSPEAHETLAVAMNRLGGDVELGRGRRGRATLRPRPERRPAHVADQAGGLGALRRHRPLPGQRRPAPDQDLAGLEARRGRPASRPQGRRVHRPAALLDPWRRADLAAAPPRHLLDRGPQAADLRPARRQPARIGLGQARRRGGRRHGRRRRAPRRTPTTS